MKKFEERSRMKPYELISHTADIGLKVNGKTLKELFENAAKGMFEIITGLSNLSNLTRLEKKGLEKTIEVKKEVEDFEELLVDWLSELLYIVNKEHIYFNGFKVVKLDNSGIIGKAKGSKIGPRELTLQTEIKAVTFHGLKIEENTQGFSCSIIFDV